MDRDWFSSSDSKVYMDDYTLMSTNINDNTGIFVYKMNEMTYNLRVPLQNGKREGKAQLINQDGLIVSDLTFTDDELTGFCIIRDDNGVDRFRGMLVNGKKQGKCIEYDEYGNEVFNGYYSHGKPYKLFEPSINHPGFICEYSENDGSLLTIAQYSADRKKTGLCYTFRDNIKVKLSHFANGIEDYIIAEFDENTMTEYSKSGKVIYIGGYLVNKRHGLGKEYLENGLLVYEGLWNNGKRSTEWKKDNNKKGFINEITNGMILSSAQYVKQKKCLLKHGTCFDFDQNRRCVRECVYANGQLQRTVRKFLEYGIMVQYGPDGQKIYEGKWSGNYVNGFCRNGKGKEFSNGKLIYDGTYQNDLRDGYGTFFINGYRRYAGEWKQGYPHGFGTLFDCSEGDNDDDNTLLYGAQQISGQWNHGYQYDFTRRRIIDYVKGGLSSIKEIEWIRWMTRDVMKRLEKIYMIIYFILICLFVFLTFKRPIMSMFSTIRLNSRILFKKGKLDIYSCADYHGLNTLNIKSIKEIHFADNCCSELNDKIAFVLQSRNRFDGLDDI